MRAYSPTTAAAFASRAPKKPHALVWIKARDMATLAVETIGLWSGADVRAFVIAGQSRTYYGAGSLLSIDPIRMSVGLQVRQQRMLISGLTPEAQQAIRGYDPRHAPIEIHRALFDPDSGNLLDEPHRVFAGFIDKISVPTPQKGGSKSVEVTMSSAARSLTASVSRKRSDASMRARAPNDAFRQYATQAENVETKWMRS